jgi:hypothetical protein
MIRKTTYKVLENNGIEYLQYLKSYRFLFFFKINEWLYIPYPNIKNKPKVICSKIQEYTQLKKFILKYPDIEKYFKNEFLERKKKYGTVQHWKYYTYIVLSYILLHIAYGWVDYWS